MRLAIGAAVCSAVVVLSLGCGGGGADGKKVAVKGKLVNGAEPFVLDQAKVKMPKGASLPPGTRLIQVTFVPEGGSGETVPVTVDESNGTFTARAAPGKYKVVILGGAGPGSPDYFEGRFSADKTQIVREVKEGEEIVIDVSKAK